MLDADEYIVVHVSPACGHCVTLVTQLAREWAQWPPAVRCRVLLDSIQGNPTSAEFLQSVPTVRVFKGASVTPAQEFQGPPDPMAVIQGLLFGAWRPA